MTITPNWLKHSDKPKKSKGKSKALLKARRQSLKAMLRKINAR